MRGSTLSSILVGVSLAAPACGGSDSGGGTSTGGKDAGADVSNTGGTNTGGTNTGGTNTGGTNTGGTNTGGTSTGGTGTGGTGTGGTGTGGMAGVGTGGSAGTGTGGSAGAFTLDCSKFAGVSADTACTSFADEYCKQFAQCAPVYFDFFALTGETQCSDRFKLVCLEAATAPGVNAKPELFAAYADWVKSQSCSTFHGALAGSSIGDTIPAGCGGPGSVADGKNCYSDLQCPSDVCAIPSDAVCGTCVTPAVGLDCSATSDCGSDYYCDTSSKCAAKVAVGGLCAVSTECVDGAYCDANDQCVAKLADGATCSSDNQCQTGLVCGSNGKCKQPALAALNASCDPNESESCDGFQGLECDATSSTCAVHSEPGPGDPCGVISTDAGYVFAVICSGGARCVTGSTGQGSCMMPAADGAACDTTTGPPCLFPAECVNSVCTLASTTSCPSN